MGISTGGGAGSSVALAVTSARPVQVGVGVNSVQSGLNAQASGISMLAKSYGDLARGMSDIGKHFKKIGDMTEGAAGETETNSAATDSALKRVADLKAQNVDDKNPDMVAAKAAAKEAYAKENRSRFFMLDWFGQEGKTRAASFAAGMK